MELSSPLAAMQPSSCTASFGCGRDLPSSRPFLSGTHPFGPNSFNFRDLSMKSDYFASKPLRGSSPAGSSLAADFSQNCLIDQSPQFPTPRRSLFPKGFRHSRESNGEANLESRCDVEGLSVEAEGAITPPVRWEGVTTPPIPSSSPGFGNDQMDISPLPHKLPFSRVAEIIVNSPTPEPTPAADDKDMRSPCAESSGPLLEVPKPVSAAERMKPRFLRPSLGRMKNFSTTTLSMKAKESQLPPFKFGAGSSSLSITSNSSMLDECFAESPPQERKTFCSQLMGPPPRPRQPFVSSNGFSRLNGSPLANHVRKSTCIGRPRKQFRRSQSMFEHPADVIKQAERKESPSPPSLLPSIMDVDSSHTPKLPHFIPDGEPDSLPRINDETLIKILNGDFNHLFTDKVVVDCRFEYEYDGGHIDGAVNYCDKESLADKLFGTPPADDTLLVFHCEYSAHRAPIMAKFVRNRDRTVNQDRYPKLSYPDVYILDGGYSSFFEKHTTRCFPQNYLRMDDKDHEQACELGLNKYNARHGLRRAQTFAMGQRICQMEDSPTTQARSNPRSLLPLDLTSDPSFGAAARLHTRRMASY